MESRSTFEEKLNNKLEEWNSELHRLEEQLAWMARR